MKVLITRLSALGDIVHSLPVAAFIKNEIPGVQLHWMVEPAGAELVLDNPAIDRVIVLRRKAWLANLRSPAKLSETIGDVASFIGNLRNQHYDAVLDLQGLLKSGLFSALAAAPVRVGYATAREGARFLYSHAFPVQDYYGSAKHVVDHNLDLAEFFCRIIKMGSTRAGVDTGNGIDRQSGAQTLDGSLRPRFPLPKSSLQTVGRLDALLNVDSFDLRRGQESSPLVALIPGTTWNTKIWPEDHWLTLAKQLLNTRNSRLVLVGGPSELESNARLFEGLSASGGAGSVLNLSGRTNVSDLIELFRRVDIVIGADTGPLHLAAATENPYVVGIYGSTPAKRNGPYGARSTVLSLDLSCQPCFSDRCKLGTIECLRELSPQMVLEKLILIYDHI